MKIGGLYITFVQRFPIAMHNYVSIFLLTRAELALNLH